ncbi:hypothetical protein APY94_08910 [Thermococcus celericrescens]|uniref:Uncharacterized protein n=1 Tax=Thermococcus celericrescens TaxID=227598 RepID=A0A100XWV7_9EURY|nr:hypothetical protein [Thermococcus celericrescens]KUH32730.1 hypothetical protein APY94_08910 [Thermococcus celericrescens]
MKLYGTEVPSILFFRWWIAELVLALLGGYFGSEGFYPEALLITGFFWLASSTLEWLMCSAYRDSEYCSLESRLWFVFSGVVPASNIFVWVFRFYPYSTAVISLLWTLLLFRVGWRWGLKKRSALWIIDRTGHKY